MIEFLAALLFTYHTTRVPPQYRHETEDARQTRIRTIAQAQVEECIENRIPGWPLKACVALGTTIAQWESGLLEEVHSGAKKGPAGEVCLFQLHRAVTAIPDKHYRITKEELEQSTGTDLDHTRMCVRLGMRIVRWHIKRCAIKYEGGGWSNTIALFAEYHHPDTYCHAYPLAMSSARAMSYQSLLHKLLANQS